MAWFRFYDDALDDPKVQRLPPAAFKTWVNLLCLSSKNNGRLPQIPEIAFALRIAPEDAAQAVAELEKAGLVDRDRNGLAPHNWNGRQYLSDRSTERVKRHRKRHSNGHETPGETAMKRSGNATRAEQSRTDSDSEQTRAEQPRAREDAVKVRQAVVAVFGESEVTLGWHWSEFSMLLDAGYTEREMLTASDKTKSRGITPKKIGSYLRPIMDEMRAGGRKAPANAQTDYSKW